MSNADVSDRETDDPADPHGDDAAAGDLATPGVRIAAARAQAGMSAGQLARRLGIETKTLHKWERDQVAPRINKLMTLAGICGVSTNWLLDGGDGGPTGDPMQSEIAHLRGQVTNALQLVDSLAATLRQVSDRLETLEADRAADC